MKKVNLLSAIASIGFFVICIINLLNIFVEDLGALLVSVITLAMVCLILSCIAIANKIKKSKQNDDSN